MKANFGKRFIAYIIDFMFITSILMLIYYAVPKTNKYEKYNNEITVLNDKFISSDISLNKYLEEYAILNSKMDKESTYETYVDLFVIIIYFIIVPVFTFGQTLGKYIMKIKIKNEKKEQLTVFSLIIRSIITNGLGYLILSLILINILNAQAYFITTSILAFIQVLTLIISGFMISYRHDLLGLEDILSKTNVVGR